MQTSFAHVPFFSVSKELIMSKLIVYHRKNLPLTFVWLGPKKSFTKPGSAVIINMPAARIMIAINCTQHKMIISLPINCTVLQTISATSQLLAVAQ